MFQRIGWIVLEARLAGGAWGSFFRILRSTPSNHEWEKESSRGWAEKWYGVEFCSEWRWGAVIRSIFFLGGSDRFRYMISWATFPSRFILNCAWALRGRLIPGDNAGTAQWESKDPGVWQSGWKREVWIGVWLEAVYPILGLVTALQWIPQKNPKKNGKKP